MTTPEDVLDLRLREEASVRAGEGNRVQAGPRDYQDPILALTQRLIEIDTSNPPGRGYEACADLLQSTLIGLGLACDRIEVAIPGLGPRYILRSVWGSGVRSIYLHGHYDVVPAQSAEQFRPRVIDGRLWGRGSADMKGGLAAMIYAIVALRDADCDLEGRVVLQLVPDEEVGSVGGSAWLTARTDLFDEGAIGMLTPEPSGGAIWNASRGAISQRVTVYGRESHVGRLDAGDNAFERMVDVVASLRRLRDELAERRTSYAIEPPEARRSLLLLGGMASSGANFNVVPGQATFTIDRRPNPEEDLAEERARLAEVIDGFRSAGYRLDVETLQEAAAAGSPDDHPVAVALAESADAFQGRRPPFQMCPGILETRWYASAGLPAYAFGPGSLDVAHGPDESVDIASLSQYSSIYAQTIRRLLADHIAKSRDIDRQGSTFS